MLNIIPLSLEQLPTVMPIEQACHEFPSSQRLLSSCFSHQYHNAQLQSNGVPVGFYLAHFVADEMTLQDLCIAPSHQGQGLGKQLLKHFIHSAESLGASHLWLEVRSSNQVAIGLYQQHGFCKLGRRVGYYPAAVGREDAVLMGLTLC